MVQPRGGQIVEMHRETSSSTWHGGSQTVSTGRVSYASGMLAHLVTGFVVGSLAWQPRHGSDGESLGIQVGVGGIGYAPTLALVRTCPGQLGRP